MGRHQTIFVNRRKLLRGIAEAITQAVDAIDRKTARQGFSTPLVQIERNHAFWPMQDLEAWADRQLTPSERLRWQEAVRQLERDGLIERQTRYLTLTAEGWEQAGIDPPPAKYSPDAETAARRRADAERKAQDRRAARDSTPAPPSLFSRSPTP